MSDIFGNEDIDDLEQQARQADAEPVEAQEEVKAEEPVEEAPKEEPVAKPMVSIDALHQARKEAQEARAKAADLEKRFEPLRVQLEEWRKSQQTQQQEAEFDTDPLGAIRREIQDLKRTQEEAQTSTQQHNQEQQRAQEMERAVAAQVQQFSQETPDYPDALNHLMQFRAQELQLWGASEAEIPQMLEAEARQIAESALQSGRNPAQIVYEMAKLRGYAIQKAKKPAQPTVEKIEKGQKAAQSLAGTQGEPEDIGLTDIAKMSDDEFDKFWDEMSKSATPRH